MPKVLTNSRDNYLSIYNQVDIQQSYVSQPLTETSSPTFDSLTLTGNLTVNGTTTVIDTDVVLVKDNIIEINTSETGAGVSYNLAGIQIERGSLTDYQIVFRETDQSVAIGEVGDLQVVATREDSPLSDGIMVFNQTNNRLDSVDDIVIPITLSANEASLNSSTGSLRISGGLGITGDTNTDSKIFFRGSDYTNYINTDISEDLVFHSGSNIVLDSVETRVPVDSLLSFGVNGNNITSDGFLLDINSTGSSINVNAFSGCSLTSTTGTLSLTAPIVSISSSSEVSIETTNTVNGISIGTDTSGVPVSIGNVSSEVTVNDNLTVVGDFTVNGTTTTVNSTVVNIEDNAIVVNSLPAGMSDGGFLVKRYQTPNDVATGQVISDTPDVSALFGIGSSVPDVLVLSNSSSPVNNYYTGWWIKITSGVCNNMVRRIKTYNGTTKVATLYITSDNTPTFADGLDLVSAPNSGDSYSLYGGTYSGAFYDDTNNEWALGRVPYDSGAGVFPLSDYQNLHVKNLTAESIGGFVSNPILVVSNTTNIASQSTANVALISTSNDRTLSGCLRITPTASLTDTIIQFTLPGVITNFLNNYDITCQLNGYQNDKSVENVIGYAVPTTTRIKIKFTSGSTDEHVIQFLVRYVAV